MAITTTDPRTGEILETFDELTPDQLEDKLARAAAAAEAYRTTSHRERSGWLRSAADLLEGRTGATAELMTLEMGKTRKASVAEVGKCVAGLRYYADNAADFLADEPVDPAAVNAAKAYARYLPLGVVLAVMPWNFPLWQAMRFAAPALAAGNVALLKHASNVPRTALFLEELFREAGFPADVFQTLLIGSELVDGVIRDDRVAAVTLTGSEAAGVAVGRTAGESLKKVVLELGGSDPFIVMPSADLAAAARVATTSRCQNNGQSCISAKRFIVHTGVYDEFVALFAEEMGSLVVGDPMVDGTDVGPLATEQGRADVEALVRDAIDKGARVLVGGERPDRAGWWYPPTLLADVTDEMDVYREEVFGPVAQVHRVEDIDEAIALGNATRFGLGSNAWTDDEEEQERFIRDLAAGQTFINGMVTSFPALPFGGVKASGHGRELAAHGVREFTNIKTVWVGHPARTGSPEEATAPLAASRIEAVVPVSDMEAALTFYHRALGLRLIEHVSTDEGRREARLGAGEGSLTIYQSEAAGASSSTIAAFLVDDLDGVLAGLRARGVEPLDYDLPQLRTERGVATIGRTRVAWIADPDGNLLGVNTV